jgi:hypothetical protein
MSKYKRKKLNQLVLKFPKGIVFTSSWLVQKGFSYELINKYKKSKWLIPIGRGAYILAHDNVEWSGGVFAIQNQLKLRVHVGGKTALQLKGLSHFVPAEIKKIFLFGSPGEKLPSWFKNYNWNVVFHYITTNLFNHNLGLSEQNMGDFTIRVSSPERAIMEVLYLVPQKQSYEECITLMENLIALRPALIQLLLENCNSIKVKRLFLHLAERFAHPWLKKLNLSKVDLGRGKRLIIKGGYFNSKYQIVVPEEK